MLLRILIIIRGLDFLTERNEQLSFCGIDVKVKGFSINNSFILIAINTVEINPFLIFFFREAFSV